MPDMPDDHLLALSASPIRVTGPDIQPLRQALEVEHYQGLDLELQVYEGTDLELRLLTGMQAGSEDGWVEVDRFAPSSANSALKKCSSRSCATCAGRC